MIIHNGDHAAFEIEHANTPPQERPDWPLPSFDARDWAKAFCKIFMVQKIAGYDTARVEDDEGLMTAWFANALMRGFDEHAMRERPGSRSGETLHQAIERILDDESAWIARPSKAVTMRIALAAAMLASHVETDHAECGSMIDHLSGQVARLKEEKHALMAALGRQCGDA